MKRSHSIHRLVPCHRPFPRKTLAPMLCGLAILIAAPAASTAEENAAGPNEQPVSDEQWKIEIVPEPTRGTRLIQPIGPVAAVQPELRSQREEPAEEPRPESDQPEAEQPKPDDAEPERPAPEIVPMLGCVDLARKYREVYASIPFIRSEYEANPSYRHEATMEILFGHLRPTVVHKHAPPWAVGPPPVPALPFGWYGLPPRGDPYVGPGTLPGHYYDFSRGPYSRYQHLFGYAGGYPLKHFLW